MPPEGLIRLVSLLYGLTAGGTLLSGGQSSRRMQCLVAPAQHSLDIIICVQSYVEAALECSQSCWYSKHSSGTAGVAWASVPGFMGQMHLPRSFERSGAKRECSKLTNVLEI